MFKLPKWLQQCFWFVGLWLGGFLTIGAVALIIRFIFSHLK